MSKKKATRKALRHLRKLVKMHSKMHNPIGRMIYIVSLDHAVELTALKYYEINETVFFKTVGTLRNVTEKTAGQHMMTKHAVKIINAAIRTQW